MRRGLAATLAALLVGAALGTPWPAASADEETTEEPISFRDPRITESSGAVVVGDWLVTTNDSGDVGRVFTVDRSTGQTVGVTTWSRDPVDVEALAPAGPASVWVGDIGDNQEVREVVTVTEVPVGERTRTVNAPGYELRYPDGPRDAESLLADPTTGRLYVASKELDGTLYAAPPTLRRNAPNLLTEVGAIGPFATDGAFFPDGRHLIMRKYGSALVFSFPELEQLDRFELPAQQQGEGVAVTPSQQLVLTSEGEGAPVLQIPLPAFVAQLLGLPGGEATADDPSAGPSDPDGSDVDGRADPSGPAQTGDPDSAGPAGLPWWAWAAAGGVALLLALAALATRTRRPDRSRVNR